MYEGIMKMFRYIIERSCDFGQTWKYENLGRDLQECVEWCEQAKEVWQGTQYRIFDRETQTYIKLIKEGFSYYEIQNNNDSK